MAERTDQTTTTLYTNRKKAAFLGIAALIFGVGIFEAMPVVSPLMDYLVLAFLGLGGAVCAAKSYRGWSYLTLSPEGFRYRILFRSAFVRWPDVEHFVALQSKLPTQYGTDMVCWNWSRSYKRQTFAKSISRSVVGCEASLPDLYGMKADALAELLNSHHNRYAQ